MPTKFSFVFFCASISTQFDNSSASFTKNRFPFTIITTVSSPLASLSAAQTLPNAGGVDSTNMGYIGLGNTGGRIWLDVYANTAITIATGQAFSIEFQSYSSDTAASAIPPFSTANAGGKAGATGTAESDAHYYIMHKTSDDGELAFSAGDLMTQMAIPEDLLRLLSHDYVQLRYLTDADEHTEKVDAFIYAKV